MVYWNHMGIFYALTAAMLGLAGNVFAKEWANKRDPALYALAAAFYIGASLVFPLALRHGTLTILNTLAATVPLVITIGIGIWRYDESISPLGMLGLSLGVIATIILTVSGSRPA